MTTASELEKLHSEFEHLKKEEAQIQGSIDTIMEQLKKYGINSIKEAEKFIRDKHKEKEALSSQLENLVGKIKKKLKK